MTAPQGPLSILVVDDDKNICHTLSLTLAEMGHRLMTAQSVDEAIRHIRKNNFDLILSDLKMNGKTGLDLIAEAKRIQPKTLIVVMTAFSSIENAVEVVREGAFDYLPKPFTNTQLSHTLNKVSRVISIERENLELKSYRVRRDFFSGFTSKESQKVEDFIHAVAPSEGTILLTGESGTGKSELARLIHTLSPRSSGPFITVCCTTLTESLVESELFGHVKGAFTGATKDKVGKLELATQGTLFLDEVGDLSPGIQAKLLRFLQEKIFEPVGSNKEIYVDARIVAATNRDLLHLVNEGKFREDLYYRLSSLECTLAPIRNRQEDLKILIDRLLSEIRGHADLNRNWGLPSEIEHLFLNYRWPGNIRELRNVLERLVILSQSRAITSEDLPKTILTPNIGGDAHASESVSLEEVEKQHIKKILSKESNFEKASQLLGITSVTLWKKRKQYGLI